MKLNVLRCICTFLLFLLFNIAYVHAVETESSKYKSIRGYDYSKFYQNPLINLKGRAFGFSYSPYYNGIGGINWGTHNFIWNLIYKYQGYTNQDTGYYLDYGAQLSFLTVLSPPTNSFFVVAGLGLSAQSLTEDVLLEPDNKKATFGSAELGIGYQLSTQGSDTRIIITYDTFREGSIYLNFFYK